MAEAPQLPIMPEFAPIPRWREISGVGRSRTYELLAAGHLRGVKSGRQLLIDVKHGLEYMRSLPAAEIRPRTKPRRRDVPPVSSVQTAPVAQIRQAGAAGHAARRQIKQQKKTGGPR